MERRGGVVIGNLADIDGRYDYGYELDVEAARRARARYQRTRERFYPLPRVAGQESARASSGDIYDAQTGEIIDESGLTIHHEVDPELKGELRTMVQTAKSRGVYIAGGLGVLLGLVLAGIALYIGTQINLTRALTTTAAKFK